MRLSRIFASATALLVLCFESVISISCIQCSKHGNNAVMTKRCLDGHVTPELCEPDKTHCLTYVEIDNSKHLQVNWRSCGTKPDRQSRENLSCMSYKFPVKNGDVDNTVYNADNKRDLGSGRQQYVRQEEQIHVCTAACDYDGCVLYRADISNDAMRQTRTFLTFVTSCFVIIIAAIL